MAKRRADVSGGGGSDLVPIKVRRTTYRLVKMAAAWFDITAQEYLDRVVKAAVSRDLKNVSKDIEQEVKGLTEED